MTQVSQPSMPSRHGGYSPATGRCEMTTINCHVCRKSITVHDYRALGPCCCSRKCGSVMLAETRERRTPTVDRFWAKVNKTEGCWNWTASVAPGGYGEIGIGSGSPYFKYANKSMKIRAPRLSWIMHNGPIPEGMDILHKCDNPRCVRPDHLFAGTDADNMRDAASKRRMPHGEGNHMTRLTLDDVHEMKRLYASGTTQRELSARYGISGSSASRIINGIDWKYA